MRRATHLLTFVRNATKKSGGSSSNQGKGETRGKGWGVKKWHNQAVKSGMILVKQRGTQFHPGFNVGVGRDYSLYALIPGFVKYYRVRRYTGKIRRYIGVEPFGFVDSPHAEGLPLLPEKI